jgi:hypothetical protein
MRHRNLLLYTTSHTTFYLFDQWNITGEAPPCFRRHQL